MIRKVLVIGGGTMGRGIAQTAAAAECEVLLSEINPTLAEKALGSIATALKRAAEKGKFDPTQIPAVLARIRVTGPIADGTEVDLAIEAIIENLPAKQALFHDLAQRLSPQTLLASNTSSLRIADIFADVKGPDRVLGIHFFNPVPAMPLVELVRGSATSDTALATGREWIERLGKTAVLVADTPGFIVNRLLIPYLNEAAQALQEGIASAEDIDTAMRLGAGHPMGPLALADMIGLDVVVEILETRARDSGNPHLAPCRLLKEKVARGELGRKSGQGFYKQG
jgi:3-hydroxybutyryl-CoA dehydrogenase